MTLQPCVAAEKRQLRLTAKSRNLGTAQSRKPTAMTAIISPLRIGQLVAHLSTGLVEREMHVRLALLAGEHLLLIGPPGTAKSDLARRLSGVFRDGIYFGRLLTRYSVPEELFGPLSLSALEEDRYERSNR